MKVVSTSRSHLNRSNRSVLNISYWGFHQHSLQLMGCRLFIHTIQAKLSHPGCSSEFLWLWHRVNRRMRKKTTFDPRAETWNTRVGCVAHTATRPKQQSNWLLKKTHCSIRKNVQAGQDGVQLRRSRLDITIWRRKASYKGGKLERGGEGEIKLGPSRHLK